MNQFIEKFATHSKGVLTGFDRLRLRGHLRQIVYARGCWLIYGTVKF